MKKQIKLLLMFTIILSVCAVAVEAKGKKYGLFVGINKYPKAIGPLAGCENDAKQMRAVMKTYGFQTADTTLLLSAAATRQAIMDNIKKYSDKAEAGDIFVFHYSGHGSLFPDSKSEEKDETKDIYWDTDETAWVDYPRDKYDSTIVPVDAMDDTSGKEWQNEILDDELYGLFSEFTKKGAQVVFISDSCFSGDIAKAKTKNVKKRFASMLNIFGAKDWKEITLKTPANQRNVTERSMNNLYIVLTGANADETALDGEAKALQMGLFTENLVAALKKTGANKLSYTDLMKTVSANVKKTALNKFDHDQNPQLEKRFGNVGATIFSVPK